MGAKNTKGQTLDQIIENQNGESKLHTGFIINTSNYVVEYYIEKAYFKDKSSKPPTVYTQQQYSQHHGSQHEYSEEWDDWKDWQNSQSTPSKRQPNKSVKSSTKKSQSQPKSQHKQQQVEDTLQYKYVLVSIPKGKLQIKGLDGILLGRSYLSICLRKQNEYLYFKKRQRIDHFSDVFVMVTNDGCEKMQKDQINHYIRQILPQFSPVKKIDQDELSQSNRSARQNHSQTGSRITQRRLF